MSRDFAKQTWDSDPLKPFTDCARQCQSADPLSQILFADMKVYLPGDLLTKVDRTSMAHGLEARAPFLDHELVEFALRLPSKEKASLLNRKIALKRAFSGILPGEILKAPKRGFAVPLNHWFRGKFAAPWQEQCLNGLALQLGYLSQTAVRNFFDEHQEGKNRDQILWLIWAFESWLRMAREEFPCLSLRP